MFELMAPLMFAGLDRKPIPEIAAAACFVGPWPVPWHMQRLCLWRTLRACGFTQAGASRRRG